MYPWFKMHIPAVSEKNNHVCIRFTLNYVTNWKKGNIVLHADKLHPICCEIILEKVKCICLFLWKYNKPNVRLSFRYFLYSFQAWNSHDLLHWQIILCTHLLLTFFLKQSLLWYFVPFERNISILILNFFNSVRCFQNGSAYLCHHSSRPTWDEGYTNIFFLNLRPSNTCFLVVTDTFIDPEISTEPT